MKKNKCTTVVLATLAFCGVVHAAGGTLKEGDVCARQQFGQLSPMTVEPVLICSHGVWKEASKVDSLAMGIDLRDKDGVPIKSSVHAVNDGTPVVFDSYILQGVPVTASNGALTSHLKKMGDEWDLVPTLTPDGTAVLLEGQISHTDAETAWNKPVHVTVPLATETVFATRPDGVTYSVDIRRRSN